MAYMKYPNDNIPFRTRPEDCRLDSPIVTMPSGRRVTALPIADGVAPMLGAAFLRASCDRDDAIAALAFFGLVLPDLETFREMASFGIWIKPALLVFDGYDQKHMQSLGYTREHDRRCWVELVKRGITPDTVPHLAKPVINFGKAHAAGAASNGNRMVGWDQTDDHRPDFIQKGEGDNHVNPNQRGPRPQQWDYGTKFWGMVP